MGKNDIIILAGLGVAAFLLLPKGKDEGGSESGGFQIPDFLTGQGTGAQPGNIFNITFPGMPDNGLSPTKKDAFASSGLSVQGYDPATGSQKNYDVSNFSLNMAGGNLANVPILKGNLGVVVPDSSFTKKSSSSGRYFAPTPYIGSKDTTRITKPIKGSTTGMTKTISTKKGASSSFGGKW